MAAARRITLTLTALLVAGLIAQAAAPAYAIMLVSRADEVRIGKQVEAQTIEEYGLTGDEKMTSRVQAVGKKVAAVSPRQDVTYTFKVLKSDTVNAFAAPGGPVLITEELARMLTDDELAFVLAHETGHIAAKHGRDAINRALIAQGVFSLIFRRAGDVTKTGVNIVYTLYDRGYSRDQEYEADSYGVRLMADAGYNSEGAVTALAKLGLKRAKGISKYFATHPDTPDRIDRVAKLAGVSKEREQALIAQAQQGG